MLSKTATIVFLAWLAVAMTAYGTEALVEARGLWAIDGDTIMVELADGSREQVRIISVSAPGLAACLGDKAQTASEALIKGRTIWLELDPESGMDRRDRNRLLAHVFLEPVQTPSAHLGTRLAEQGLAKLDVRDPRDEWPEDHFDIRYVSWIIAAQVEAAKRKSGWWGECDPYRDSDLVIAAIKQWGDEETVYMVNRGAESIDVSRLELKDSAGNSFVPHEPCILPSGGILLIHSGPICTGRKGQHTPCGEPKIEWCWWGRRVWDNRGDEA
ncbi:MAG: hypothetical protein ABID40_03400, partial [Candidatus Bipolaricaulota bacterium]